jgi:hypothetical protein
MDESRRCGGRRLAALDETLKGLLKKCAQVKRVHFRSRLVPIYFNKHHKILPLQYDYYRLKTLTQTVGPDTMLVPVGRKLW